MLFYLFICSFFVFSLGLKEGMLQQPLILIFWLEQVKDDDGGGVVAVVVDVGRCIIRRALRKRAIWTMPPWDVHSHCVNSKWTVRNWDTSGNSRSTRRPCRRLILLSHHPMISRISRAMREETVSMAMIRSCSTHRQCSRAGINLGADRGRNYLTSDVTSFLLGQLLSTNLLVRPFIKN